MLSSAIDIHQQRLAIGRNTEPIVAVHAGVGQNFRELPFLQDVSVQIDLVKIFEIVTKNRFAIASPFRRPERFAFQFGIFHKTKTGTIGIGQTEMPLLFRHDGERELRSVRRPNRPEAIVARNIFYNRNLPARHICDGYAALGTGILRITFGVERDARAVRRNFGQCACGNFFRVFAIEIGNENILAAFIRNFPLRRMAERGNAKQTKMESVSGFIGAAYGALTDGKRPFLIRRFKFSPSTDIR